MTSPPAENTTADPLGFAQHDHSACVGDTLAAAEARCAADGLRFTPVRRRVLEILLQEHRAEDRQRKKQARLRATRKQTNLKKLENGRGACREKV